MNICIHQRSIEKHCEECIALYGRRVRIIRICKRCFRADPPERDYCYGNGTHQFEIKTEQEIVSQECGPLGEPRLAIDLLQEYVGDWGKKTFGQDNPDAIVEHLLDEALELREAIKKDGPTAIRNEAADVLILLFGIAHRLGFDLGQAVVTKMMENKTRSWGAPDSRGVIRHKGTKP